VPSGTVPVCIAEACDTISSLSRMSQGKPPPSDWDVDTRAISYRRDPGTGLWKTVSPEEAAKAGADTDAGSLVVARSGRWFRPVGGEVVGLFTRKSLRLMLKELADLRESAPNTAVTLDTLLAAGWPDEKVNYTAGAARVYSALATLRRLGMREVLLRRDDGYLLDPSVPIVRADEEKP